MRSLRASLAAALLAAAALLPTSAGAKPAGGAYFVYFGTYTINVGKGIYAARFDPSTGQLTPMGLVAETSSPSFLAVHPSGRFLYAANEHNGEDKPGKNDTVSAFAVDRTTGKLTFLNKVSSGGEGPCAISMDRAGTTLFVANYRSGSVAVLPIGADGHLGEVAAFDQQPDPPAGSKVARAHAHFALPSPDGRFVLSADPPLGRVYVYRFDPIKRSLVPGEPAFVQVPDGLGPRHIAFGRSGAFAYVNHEQGSEISTFAYDAATGGLNELQRLSTLPAGFTGRSGTAELQIDRSGRFLYVSNRGDNSLATFAIDQSKGTLALVEHQPTGGKVPRYFAFDPTGGFLLAANQASNTIVVNRVDAATGHYVPVQTLADIPEPVCIAFVPAG